MIKFVHTNIITDDWKKLSEFYIQVFDCKPLLPERDLNGDWLAKATNIKNAHLKGIHLLLPGYENPPTLEIFEYDKNEPNLKPLANRKGFGHIAFRVSNVNDVLNKVLNHGGSKLGEVVETNIPNVGKLTFVVTIQHR